MTAENIFGPRTPGRPARDRGADPHRATRGAGGWFGRGALVLYGLTLAALGAALALRSGTAGVWRSVGVLAVLLALACVVLATRVMAPLTQSGTSRAAAPDPNVKPGIALMPSDVSSRVGTFDRFAGLSAKLASRAPFFIACIALVLAWLVEGIVKMTSGGGWNSFQDSAYQLQINTTTTIITFLLVALLQNSATRSDQATQHKLNAIADGLADFMEQVAQTHKDKDLCQDLVELRQAVGLENREDTSKR
jgi:low affinity Fe/Cu permease